jgi:hypothetical protein
MDKNESIARTTNAIAAINALDGITQSLNMQTLVDEDDPLMVAFLDARDRLMEAIEARLGHSAGGRSTNEVALAPSVISFGCESGWSPW